MIDGRTVYSPLFSGVQWFDQQIIMEDLDRIEVIRGPGASLWGANAVNGVVNITTKSAKDTVGGFGSILFGDYLKYQVVGRQGIDLGDDRYIRFYAKHFSQDQTDSDSPLAEMEDAIKQTLVGFRYDWDGEDRGKLTIQGDFAYTETNSVTDGYSLVPPYGAETFIEGDSHLAYLLARWSRPVGNEGEFSIQGYIDYKSDDAAFLSSEQISVDVDAQLSHVINDNNEFVTGFGVRRYDDNLRNSERFMFIPDEDNRWLLSAFFQNEYKAIPDKFHVTVGAKVEHTEYADFEFQPSLRLLYMPEENQTIWASIARAARTPSRGERSAWIAGMIIPPNQLSPIPTKAILQGNADYDSEDLVALEFGHRISAGERLSFDTSLFYNQYDNLRSLEPGGISQLFSPVPHNIFTTLAGNGIKGSTQGAEIAVNMQPSDKVRMQGTFSYIDFSIKNKATSMDSASVAAYEGSTPKTQLGLRIMYDVSEDWEFDVTGHHTSSLSNPGIGSNTALDARLAWKPSNTFELALVGRDLLDSEHVEFPPTYVGGTLKRIPRSYYLRANWNF